MRIQLNKEQLRAESFLITRYLLRCDPSEELSKRYVDANLSLLAEQHSLKRNPELSFIRRYPMSLPFIDAAAGLLSPESIVRKKILIMTAILEATPVHASFFLQRQDSAFKVIGSLAWQGLRSMFKLAIGIPIYMLIRRG
jgi:hypothetical protein